MKLGYTILYVADVSKTLEFYETAFELKRRFLTPDSNYGELETGDTRLAFGAVEFVRTLLPISFLESRLADLPPPLEIGFVTDDVQTAYSRAVSAGAVAVKPPTEKPWGQVVGYVRDLNGFIVEICSPMP